MNSMQEEYEINSPSWPRTPASPVSCRYRRVRLYAPLREGSVFLCILYDFFGLEKRIH